MSWYNDKHAGMLTGMFQISTEKAAGMSAILFIWQQISQGVREVSQHIHTYMHAVHVCAQISFSSILHLLRCVCFLFHSELTEDGLAEQRPTHRARERERESVKISRLSVSQSAPKAEQSGTAAFPLLISSIDCLNGCHWRWRDRQAAFVSSTEKSCGATPSPTLKQEAYTSAWTMQNVLVLIHL